MVLEQIIGLGIAILVVILICMAGKVAFSLFKILKGLVAYGIVLTSPDNSREIPDCMYEGIALQTTEGKTYQLRLTKATLSKHLESLKLILHDKRGRLAIGGEVYDLGTVTTEQAASAFQGEECTAFLTIYSENT